MSWLPSSPKLAGAFEQTEKAHTELFEAVKPRFQTAQMWGQIAMYDLAGESPPGAISPSKLAAVQQAAIAACDKNDGVGCADRPKVC
jgi:hypothetical protein